MCVEHHFPGKRKLHPGSIQFVKQFVANGAPQSLPEHVKQKRIDLKLTQLQLGELVGLGHECICKIERGRSKIQSSTRAKLIKWLGFDPDYPTS
jgi:DNA-binding XRE family transcriptional regulator